MMRDTRIRRMPMALSALVALALAVLPLPAVLDAFRPDFLVLVVFYWCIESPRSGGLSLAFFSGLALDVIHGVVLGQHALALTLMGAWATHLRLRIRVFSMMSRMRFITSRRRRLASGSVAGSGSATVRP